MAKAYVTLQRYTIPAGSGPDKFYGQLAWLEGTPIHSPQEIARYQYNTLREYMQNRFSNSGLISMINADMSEGNIKFASANFIDDAITEIEQAFKEFSDSIDKSESFNLVDSNNNIDYSVKYTVWENELENLAGKINNIYQQLKSDGILSNYDLQQLSSMLTTQAI